MAPTSDERREVAARLRSAAKTDSGSPDYLWNRLEIAVNGWRFGDVIDDSYVFDNSVLARLADLIDPQERTCHPKGDWKPVSQTQKARRLVCDCGYELGVDRKDAAPFDLSIMCELPNFCPNCGARLVGE